MKIFTICALGLAVAVACGTMAYAQDSSTTDMGQHPKILQIMREWEKPGKAEDHEKTESAFAAAFRKANVPVNYFGACAITGKPRCLYFIGFDSYEAWEKADKSLMSNKELSAEISSITKDDTALLESSDQATFSYSKGLSYKDDHDVAHARFIEIDSFRIKPGHFSDFSALVRMMKEGNDKAGNNIHWSAYHLDYGGDPQIVNFFTAHKSMADIDSENAETDKFWEKLGEAGHKRFEELYAAAVDSEVEQLLRISPMQSYVPDAWIKADPDFWTVKTEEAPKGKEKKK